MEILRLLKRAPLHIGELIRIENAYIEDKETIYWLLTDKHKLMYFRDSNRVMAKDSATKKHMHKSGYYFFQYKDTDTLEIDCICHVDQLPLQMAEYKGSFRGDDNMAIIRTNYGDKNEYSYYLDESVLETTNVKEEYGYVYDDFSNVENILLDYVYSKRPKELGITTFLKWGGEIREYVDGLDIDNIIDSYYIRSLSTYIKWGDYYSATVYGYKDVRDKYLDSILPHVLSGSYHVDRDGGASEAAKNGMADIESSVETIKHRAKDNYSKEQHIYTLMFERVKQAEEKMHHYNRRYVYWKQTIWNRDFGLQYIMENERRSFDMLKVAEAYNRGEDITKWCL